MTEQQEQRSWAELYTRLLAGEDLSADDTGWAMGRIMGGEATGVQVAGLLVALRAKGETAAEMRGLADEMLAHAIRIEAPARSIDIVGTGGDRAHTVNISTMAAIVCAAAGLPVVKHGNRAASSSSGSADVLEALGVDLSLPPERVAELVHEVGITFCFAQQFHPSMRHAAGARRELGIATAFNFLGPLTNPGQPTYAAIGVADPRMAPVLAGVMAERGRAAVVMRGDDGLDEVTLSTTSSVWWVRDGSVSRYTLDPQRIGVSQAATATLRGGDPAHNAQVVRDVFASRSGPIRDAVVLNAGIALAVADETQPVTDEPTLHEAVARGMERAADAIDGGGADEVLQRWVAATRRPA